VEEILQVEALLDRIAAWPVTSNREFRDATVDYLRTLLAWLQNMIACFPDKAELSGHMWDAVYDEKSEIIVCKVDWERLESLKEELEQILEQEHILSTLQFIFVLFTCAFRAEAALQNKPGSIFKKLHLNLRSLESIAFKKSHFSEEKGEAKYQVFKQDHVSFFSKLSFKDFALESVAFEKNLNRTVEDHRHQLSVTKESLNALQDLLQEPIVKIAQAVNDSFLLVPNRLIFQFNDYHTITKGSRKTELPVLLSDDRVKAIIDSQLLESVFYLTQAEFDKLRDELAPLPEELREIILSLVESAEGERIYNSQKKSKELSNLGIFACQKDGQLLLDNLYRRRVSFNHVKEIRGYLRDYEVELQLNVVTRLMTSFVIGVTHDQARVIEEVKKDFFANPALRQKLQEAEVHTLASDKALELSQKVEQIFLAHQQNFEKFYDAYENKNELTAKIDSLNDKITFELLALEFFGIFK
jgi:hypothetical protein